MGHSYMQAVIHSSKERTPRAVKVLYSASVGGKSTDIFEVGIVIMQKLDMYLCLIMSRQAFKPCVKQSNLG